MSEIDESIKVSTPISPTSNSFSTGFIDPKVYLQQHQKKQAVHSNQAPASKPKNSDSPQIKNMIQTTQLNLNLSSEDEAANALISLGYQQIKKYFHKPQD